MYPSTTGRFLATIGYVAPSPNHVHLMFKDRCLSVRGQVWFAVVCVQLMLGDVSAAKESCKHFTGDSEESLHLQQLTNGLCLFAEKDYKGERGLLASFVRYALLWHVMCC